ncbi:hypothetical protein [Aquabacterium sp.]|uniref:hypothetical protein n=1 Tax=Aquabacterium sp. TaxID=1872578 RepID=UPI0037844B25
MIQVQIASTLDASGVSGLRWVLIDPSDSGEPAPAAAAATVGRAEPAAPAAPMPGAPIRRTPLALQVTCAALLLVALLGAWWVTERMLDARGPGARQAALNAARTR